MKETFRQSMIWLPSWLGLGWLLYFVFLTGASGLVHFEISRMDGPRVAARLGHADGV